LLSAKGSNKTARSNDNEQWEPRNRSWCKDHDTLLLFIVDGASMDPVPPWRSSCNHLVLLFQVLVVGAAISLVHVVLMAGITYHVQVWKTPDASIINTVRARCPAANSTQGQLGLVHVLLTFSTDCDGLQQDLCEYDIVAVEEVVRLQLSSPAEKEHALSNTHQLSVGPWVWDPGS
jgi:hypothetical protein